MVACTLCYLEKDGQYLMLHRIRKEKDVNAGKWIGVGGHIEAGETPEECAIREVKEETGLTLHSCELRGIVDFLNDSWESEIMYLYTSSDFEGEVIEDCDEGVLSWVPIPEVPKLPTWEGDLIFLKALAENRPFFHLQVVYRGNQLVSHRYLPRIILASASPRRRELIQQLGLLPEIHPSTKPEVVTTAVPQELVQQLSRQKAEDVAGYYQGDALIIGADTVVAVDGQIMGKPGTHEEAEAMISSIAGRTHQVYTGVTVIRKTKAGQESLSFAACTQVEVYPMTQEEICAYAMSEEPMDKAGAYGIQGGFAAFVKGIQGDYANVVGLPVGELYQQIKHWI